MPLITPELCKDLVDFDGVTSDSVVVVFDGCNSFFGSRKGATNSGKLVSSSLGGGIIGIGSKLGVDKIKQGSTITVRGEEGVNSGMKREVFNYCSTVNLASRVSGVKYSDSVPEEAVTIRFEVGRRANFKVGSSKNLLEGRKVLKRTSLRLNFFPQSIDRIQEVRGVYN
jgi:hypothetical protein